MAEGGQSACDLFVDWLRRKPQEVEAALARVVPPAILGEVGISDWSWVPALTDPSEQDLTHGWLRRAAEEVRDELEMVRNQMQDAIDKQQFARAEMLKRLSATIAGRQLYGFLASRNVLPKYGFPLMLSS